MKILSICVLLNVCQATVEIINLPGDVVVEESFSKQTEFDKFTERLDSLFKSCGVHTEAMSWIYVDTILQYFENTSHSLSKNIHDKLSSFRGAKLVQKPESRSANRYILTRIAQAGPIVLDCMPWGNTLMLYMNFPKSSCIISLKLIGVRLNRIPQDSIVLSRKMDRYPITMDELFLDIGEDLDGVTEMVLCRDPYPYGSDETGVRINIEPILSRTAFDEAFEIVEAVLLKSILTGPDLSTIGPFILFDFQKYSEKNEQYLRLTRSMLPFLELPDGQVKDKQKCLEILLQLKDPRTGEPVDHRYTDVYKSGFNFSLYPVNDSGGFRIEEIFCMYRVTGRQYRDDEYYDPFNPPTLVDWTIQTGWLSRCSDPGYVLHEFYIKVYDPMLGYMSISSGTHRGNFGPRYKTSQFFGHDLSSINSLLDLVRTIDRVVQEKRAKSYDGIRIVSEYDLQTIYSDCIYSRELNWIETLDVALKSKSRKAQGDPLLVISPAKLGS